MSEYDPKQIEAKWQAQWEKLGIYQAKDKKLFGNKPKWYSLIEFPYPSGDGLHVGHPRPYIGMDVISRKRRMEGYNVLYPIGWDAFGLPTENYAIKTGKDPRQVTKENTDTFRRQIKSLGISFDWSREINTTDPKYYKWTQWLFLKFLEKGLAYKARIPINWCPKDKIGLANEEVVDGKCERCGTPVELKDKEQWMLKITAYADRLYDDLETVDYPERVKAQQRNWIGKSEGALIKFDDIEVFTTRPDTIYGATFLVRAGKQDRFTGEYATNPATKEKIPVWEAEYVYADYGTGAIMGVPAHDERDYEFAQRHDLPIREVLIPNIIDKRNPPVPGKKFVERQSVHPIVFDKQTGKFLAIKWKKFPWTTFPMGGVEEGEDIVEAARREVKEETGYKNLKLIKVLEGHTRAEYFAAHKDQNRISFTTAVVFELENDEHDELSPEEADQHEVIWLDEKDMNYEVMTHAETLEWQRQLKSGNPVFSGEGVLANSGEFTELSNDDAKRKIVDHIGGKWVTKFKLRDWVFSRQRYWGEPIPVIHCEKCGVVPVPEKDLPVLLPEVAKYEPGPDGESPLANISEWVNAKCPKCGGDAKRETDVMPNWAGSSWYFLRYADPENEKDFASRDSLKHWMPVDWYNGGMEHTTLHLLYSRFWNKFLFDIGLVPSSEPYMKRTSHGLILAEGGKKMSKSLGNVVNPDSIVGRLGADTLRVYEMFMGPFEQAIAWSDDSLVGPRRFLEKVWRLREKVGDTKPDEYHLHTTVKKVSEDVESMGFNTAISAMMVWVNELEKKDSISKTEYESLLLILAPFAPHITEELWHMLGNTNSIHTQDWPKYDESKLVKSEVTIAIQVNGKVRGSLSVSSSRTPAELEKLAKESPEIGKWLLGKEVQKVIVVPQKIVNIVVK
jgi:leucyl-tRNA synthetase